ncbi:unnamed protein product (macronuclear) [Paramecium tetraurelia]|uniref:Uncharacterized protein n=1 Tax=Paramecium tetraurelia TaxID=5888 RepID=A0CEK7_PARTE|nr:uncharacterized protein GSPATT00037662001 [Paramecium tetraurelia]CAK69224.1 unnamed protein product [Paramecium tetraurelia]|eukprot:XP_001436621.1 hypothetical protein (macronuclear) [Paramecium tetraurelia strain d4-2]
MCKIQEFNQPILNQIQKSLVFDKIDQPQSNGFQIVDYFHKQCKNVSEWMFNHDQLKLELQKEQEVVVLQIKDIGKAEKLLQKR